jgi:hypothetical protein
MRDDGRLILGQVVTFVVLRCRDQVGQSEAVEVRVWLGGDAATVFFDSAFDIGDIMTVERWSIGCYGLY